MRAESAFNPLFRSPLHFDRMPDHTRPSVREGTGGNHILPHGAVSGAARSATGTEQREQVPARPVRLRYDLLMEDLTGLLGSAVVYVLALLGLLHLLGFMLTP